MGKICNNVFNPISASTIDSLRTCYANNYLARIQENPKYKSAVTQLLQRIQNRAKIAKAEEKVVSAFSDVYTVDKKIYMQRFLTDGPNVPLKDEYTVDPEKKHKVTRTIVKGG